MTTLNLGLIGNGTVAALVDQSAEIVWACVPRIDGDPVFFSLLQPRTAPADPRGFGYFGVEIEGAVRKEQEYLPHTPILITRIYDGLGNCAEVTDFAPRFERFGRIFCPMMLVRIVRPIRGLPRVRFRVRPGRQWGSARRDVTFGSHHIRYVGADPTLRLTTDASISAVLEENAILLDEPISFILGPDESVDGAPRTVGAEFLESTTAWWREWVSTLAIPFEWQDDVIRAAISLQLNAIEDTGAIIAAVTTSIPEAPDSGRNWDYRHCWLRDGYLVVNTLNRLGVTRTMERFLRFVTNIAAGSADGKLQPVYGISGVPRLEETLVTTLAGYRGMGPVRIGNQAYAQVQHDVYGSAILACAHVFFDRRLSATGTPALFERLEALGNHAIRSFPEPDAGIWELRNRSERHTYSAVMCWAACDRLARIGEQLGLRTRADGWRAQANAMRAEIVSRAWNQERQFFASTLGGNSVDASLLLLADIGFLQEDDPRFASTVDVVARELKRGDFVFRYAEEDDFGAPQNAFLVCSFWYVNALAALGRRGEARELFETLLSCRNSHGLFAEHIDPGTREQWGNYVQTYSMVGLISAAIRLSARWDQAF